MVNQLIQPSIILNVKPSFFIGTFIQVKDRIMVWQNCTIHTGYVYLP